MLGAQDTQEVNIQLLLVGVGVWVARASAWLPFLALTSGESAPGWAVGPWERVQGHVGSEVTENLGYFLPQNNLLVFYFLNIV